MRTGIAIATCVLITLGGAARADDKPIDRTELDKWAARIAYDATVTGTGLFNQGEHLGCYRLYQGTLQALTPLLDHRPKLAAAVKEKMDKAKMMKPVDGAFALREALDLVAGAEAVTKKPLWDRLGGEKAVRAVVHDFVVAAAGDPKVNFFRDGAFKLDAKGVERLEQMLVELVSATTGGPLKYTGRDMKTAHKGMMITEAEFGALAGHLVATLKKYNVPQAEIDELVGIVASTKKDIVEGAKKEEAKKEVSKKPLWDRLGGEKGVRAVTREFLVNAAKDPKVNLDRGGNYPLTNERVERVEQQLVELVSAVTGGPLKYTGRDMKAAHKGMMITEAEFGAAAGHLVAALKKFEVPQAEIDELIGIIATTKKEIVEKK
jgi:hemoglobin